MKTLLKPALYLSAFVVALLLAAGLWIANLDPNEYKDWIVNKVQQETGRTLTLNGEIGFSLYPWLGIEANNVTLGNAAGFADEPFFHADYFQFRVRTVPLLQGRYEIDTASIHGAVINLARNAQGANWDDFVGGEAQESADLPLAIVIPGGLDIQDAEINWRNQTTDTHYRLDNINISTGQLVYGEPVDVSLALHVAADKPALSGKIQLRSIITYDLDNERYTIPVDVTGTVQGNNIPGGSTKLSLSSVAAVNLQDDTIAISDLQFSVLGAEVSADLSASKWQSPSPSVQTTFTAKVDDLSRLFRIMELEPLASRLAGLPQRSFTLKASLDADMERGDIHISQFSTAILGAEIAAEIKAYHLHSKTPEFEAALQADGPDLPALLQTVGQFAGRDSSLSHYGRQLAAADNKGFAVKADFDVDMKSGDIDIPMLSVQTLDIDIAGRLKANKMQAKDGSVNGRLSVKGKGLAQVLGAIEQQALADVLRSVDLVTGVSGTLHDLRLQPLILTLGFSGKHTPDAEATLSLNAETDINLPAGKLNLKKLEISGLGLDASGRLRMDKLQSERNFSGEINVAPFNLRKLLRWLNQEAPVTADKKALGKVALSTQFSGAENTLNVSRFELMLDETRLVGNLRLDDHATPVCRFDMALGQINVDRYLPPPRDKKKALETTTGTAAQLPVALVQNLDVKGDINIDKLTIANVRASDVVLRLNGKDGKINMAPLTANLYQGRYSGNITIDATGKLPRIRINSTLQGIQLEPLLHDVTGEAKLRGRGDLDAALTALGADTEAMKKTLQGYVNFNFRDGALKGFNLGRLMRQGKSLQNNFSLKVSAREETDLSELSGNALVQSGVIRLDDLKGSATGLRLSGRGVLANLPENHLNYQLTANIVATSKGQGGRQLAAGKLEGLPLECTFQGPLDNPERTCDASKLVAALTQKLLKELTGAPNEADKDAQEVDPVKKLKKGLDVLQDIFDR